MKEKVVKFGTHVYWKYPFLRPYMAFIHRTFFIKPKFSGWGMKTEAELPWDDEYSGEIFLKANEDIKKIFEFTQIPTGPNRNNIDVLMWRHWIVSYATRHAIEFAKSKDFNFVECGVGDGLTTFFALREIVAHKKTTSQLSMHLYDSWSAMRKEGLFESELNYVGRYGNLDINRTKRNLTEFKEGIVYHQGYIPQAFHLPPDPPNSIVYLSIDLNSAQPTLDTLHFFFPRLARGGIILFDDYGQVGYVDTRKTIDKFFSDKPGILLKLPTSQAIYYR